MRRENTRNFQPLGNPSRDLRQKEKFVGVIVIDDNCIKIFVGQVKIFVGLSLKIDKFIEKFVDNTRNLVGHMGNFVDSIFMQKMLVISKVR